MILEILIFIGILAVCWDIFALYQWSMKDMTVSGFIYRLVHRFPILAAVAGGAIIYYFPQDVIPIIAGGLISHFVWRA